MAGVYGWRKRALLKHVIAAATVKSAYSSATWILKVADNASIDTGGVRAFSLRLRGYTCTP